MLTTRAFGVACQDARSVQLAEQSTADEPGGPCHESFHADHAPTVDGRLREERGTCTGLGSPMLVAKPPRDDAAERGGSRSPLDDVAARPY